MNEDEELFLYHMVPVSIIVIELIVFNRVEL